MSNVPVSSKKPTSSKKLKEKKKPVKKRALTKEEIAKNTYERRKIKTIATLGAGAILLGATALAYEKTRPPPPTRFRFFEDIRETTMNLRVVPRSVISIVMDYNAITTINWKGSPKKLLRISINNNRLTSINWEGAPRLLEKVSLENNAISAMEWKDCPKSLKEIKLNNNRFTSFHFKDCPPGLEVIDLRGNQITSVDWEGCPENLVIYPTSLGHQFQRYKETPAYLRNITKPKRNINAEIDANSMLPPNNKIKVFNNKGYKQNFYDMVDEVKGIIGATSPRSSQKSSRSSQKSSRSSTKN